MADGGRLSPPPPLYKGVMSSETLVRRALPYAVHAVYSLKIISYILPFDNNVSPSQVFAQFCPN